MSVRSFLQGIGALVVGLFALFAWSLTPVFANSCSFACVATFIAPPLTGSLSSCTSDTQCQDLCATTCGRLGSPRAFVDRAHPSSCAGTPRACTPCSCTPDVQQACEGTDAGFCGTTCNTICSAYNASRSAGVASIVCGAGPTGPAGAAAPACVESAPTTTPSGAGAGSCRFACTFGPTAQIRTTTSCSSTSPCVPAALSSSCTAIGLQPSTTTECRAGDGGNKCEIVCNRPTAVSETDRGTCTAGSGTPTDADLCRNRCQTVCGGRGMVCADGAQCNSSGRCEFSCQPTAVGDIQYDRACSLGGNSTTIDAATQFCANRCQAFCSERGGECATSPEAICYVRGNQSAGGDPGSTTPSDGTPPNRPPQIQRTAPTFNVTFPDPFGGNLSLPTVIGTIVRVLVGMCGVFFLGVFVYGGVLYLTSAGDAKDVKKGQQAIVNAVIGLVVVLFAYLAVSLIVQLSNQLQTGEIAPPDESQNAQDDGALRPGGTTRATGRSSQGGDQTAPGQASTDPSAPAPEPGSPGAACRTFYGADPATCSATGGGCPAGVTDLAGLMTAWGRSFPAATRDIPDPAASCRTCLETGIRSLQGRYAGINTSCVPALVNLWSTSCHDVCNPRSVTEEPSRSTADSDICNAANYNTANAGCSRCVTYWSNPSRAGTIAEVGCPTLEGKVMVWCAGAESPSRTSRPQSGGYCSFTAPRR